MDFIKKFDIFDKEVKLKYEGESFKTSLGGLLSIIVFAGTIILSWYFGKEMYELSNPKYIINRNQLPTIPVIPINKTNFAFGAKITDYNGDTIDDPRAFVISAWLWGHGLNETTKFVQMEMTQCSNVTVKEPYFTDERMKNYKCPVFDTDFGGANNQDLFYSPYIYIYSCGPDQEQKFNTTCYTDKELYDKYGELIIIKIKYQQEHANPRNFVNSTLISYQQKEWWIKTVGVSYTSSLVYSVSRMVTDQGKIFEEERELNFFQFESLDFYNVGQVATTGISKEPHLQLDISLSRTENYYHREYLKLPDAIANVGGFIGIVYQILHFMISFYVENSFCISFYKSLFKLEIENQTSNEIVNDINYNNQQVQPNINQNFNNQINNKENSYTSKLDIELKEINPINKDIQLNNSYDKLTKFWNPPNPSQPPEQLEHSKSIRINKLKLLGLNENIINKDVSNIINFKQKKREKVVIRPCERFCYINCASCYITQRFAKKKRNYNLRYELIDQVEIEIEKKLDIIDILKKNDQFRCLKKALLNENQCFLLENRDYHTIVNEKGLPTEKIENLHDLKQKQKFVNLIDYLNMKKSEGSFSNIDVLFLKYLNEDMKDRIKKEIGFD